VARKEIDITISEGTPETNRDFGKTFHIREMSASQAEKWAVRMLMIATKSGADIGNAEGLGMAGIAMLGAEAVMKANFGEIEPLLDEMMACVSIKPDRNNPNVVRGLIEDDIEEIKTRFELRREVLKLHMGFSQQDSGSTQTGSPPQEAPTSSNIPTFPEPSVRFSQSPKTKHKP